MTATTPPRLGLGMGWRPEIAWFVDRRRDLGFVEVLAEDLDSRGPLPEALLELKDRGVAIVPHGVSLSLGGPEPLDHRRLEHLARLADRLGSPLVSEHVAFVRAGGVESGHLLPLPRTREAVDLVVERAKEAQRALPVPLALENVASLFAWPEAEMDEAEFLAAVLAGSGAGLLLDVANVYADTRNHGLEAGSFFDRIPLEHLAYVHVAGGLERQGLYHDTHTRQVPPAVLALLTELCRRTVVPGVLLERDDDFPADAELGAELDAIAAAAGPPFIGHHGLAGPDA